MNLIDFLIIPIFVCSWMGVFLYKKYAIFNGIISNPNYRTLHEVPIPSGGGVIFSLLFILSIFLIWLNQQLSNNLFFMLGVGGVTASLLGFKDDISNIKASNKLIIQLILSSWVIFCLYLDNLLYLNWLPIFILIPVLLFVMVWFVNAYNFIDGVDGMAASGAIFLSLTLALVLFLTDKSVELIPVFILIAILVGGFISFNWPPASIFMGDAGSVFLGYTFGSLMLYTTLNGDITVWVWITVFGYFFADTMVTQIVRVILVEKWYLPHRSHAYQNLARITASHSKVTSGVVLYNILWVLPLTLLSVFRPENEVIIAILANLPALIIAYKYGPLYSSS